jgi:hypothetical protein
MLGSYLALWAWRKRIDCVVIHRDELHPYLGIKARRQQRLRWLVADIKDLFPYVQELYQGRTRAHGSLYLSRVRFPRDVFDDSMYDVDRIGLLRQHGLTAAMITKLPTERRMGLFLTSAVIGGSARSSLKGPSNTRLERAGG